MANKIERVTFDELIDYYGIRRSQIRGLDVGCYEMFKLDKHDEDGYRYDLTPTGGLSVNCRCLVIAPTIEEAQRLLDQTDPEASGYTGTHLWLNSKFATLKKYEIGGQVVCMTEQQAEDWNEGNITAETMRWAILDLPNSTKAIDLWYACEDQEFYYEWLRGFPANPVA